MAKNRATPKKKRISDQIRKLINESGLTMYAIAKQSGIDTSALSRFMSGERGLSMTALDTLGELFDWEISERSPKR